MEDIIDFNGKKYKKISDKHSNYFMVRTYSAGVFYGIIEKRDHKEIVLRDARRVWYWKGAATLSELAQNGTSNPEECKFPCSVDEVILTEVIEIIPITEKALETLNKVKVWSAHE